MSEEMILISAVSKDISINVLIKIFSFNFFFNNENLFNQT